MIRARALSRAAQPTEADSIGAGNIHISATAVVNAGRILKETLSVARSGLFSSVIICGTAEPGLPRHQDLTHGRRIERVGSEVVGRNRHVLGRIREQLSWSRAVFKRYSSADVTVINAHSVAVLPVCYLLSRRCRAKLIYDTHELETETVATRGLQGVIFKCIERLLITKCDAIFVVNESIADWYRKRYPGVRPVIIRNIPRIEEREQPAGLRDLLSIPAGKLLFIHVGHLVKGRNIQAILAAFSSLAAEAHIIFLGQGEFEERVRAYCARYPNIHWLTPVPPDQVVRYVAACDVGLCLIEPGCLSYKLSLPNKAFEYIKAGIPFFFTDLPEVNRLLGSSFDEWRIGEPARDLRGAVSRLTVTAVAEAKASLAAFCLPPWDEEAKAMVDAYASLIASASH